VFFYYTYSIELRLLSCPSTLALCRRRRRRHRNNDPYVHLGIEVNTLRTRLCFINHTFLGLGLLMLYTKMYIECKYHQLNPTATRKFTSIFGHFRRMCTSKLDVYSCCVIFAMLQKANKHTPTMFVICSHSTNYL
jgi:hypothetical protein